jgi:hypothetical protein
MPVEQVFPGVEVHAKLIAGILDQNLKHQPKYMVGVVAVADRGGIEFWAAADEPAGSGFQLSDCFRYQLRIEHIALAIQ